MVPRETENNAYAKFWSDKQRALWYFLQWSIESAVYGDVSYGMAPMLMSKHVSNDFSKDSHPVQAPVHSYRDIFSK